MSSLQLSNLGTTTKYRNPDVLNAVLHYQDMYAKAQREVNVLTDFIQGELVEDFDEIDLEDFVEEDID